MLSLSFLVTLLYAQQRQITGTVRDNAGAPVVGATFIQKGTNNGGSTDDNGAFSTTVTGVNPVLVFSSVGFANLEVPPYL